VSLAKFTAKFIAKFIVVSALKEYRRAARNIQVNPGLSQFS